MLSSTIRGIIRTGNGPYSIFKFQIMHTTFSWLMIGGQLPATILLKTTNFSQIPRKPAQGLEFLEQTC